MRVKPYLKVLAENNGSDLYFSTGALPSAKFNGILKPMGKDKCPPGYVEQLASELMDEQQRADFQETLELNMALSISGIGRFRVNVFRQRGEVAMVIRYINTDIPSIESLGIPEVLTEIVMANRGLILFIGGTGMGKSTTQAALIDYRNQNSKGHIITIEDPIEFIHEHKNCIVNQREIGMDTHGWENALANAMRQGPDVILIGEIRDRESMENALSFAESGHLTLATLHANNANQALDRIVNFFPSEQHRTLLQDLSLYVRAFVSQRLIPTVNRQRCAAFEVLLNSPSIADLIKDGNIAEIKDIMAKSKDVGMQTFDMHLLKLYQQGDISREEALRNADSENDLSLKMGLTGDDNRQDGDGSLDDLVFPG